MKNKVTKSFLTYWVTTAILLGTLIHIFSILTMPYLAPANAWTRFNSALTANHMTVLPQPRKNQPSIMPFQASDIRYAVCRYDITAGPVLITAEIPDDLWTVALYTSSGENFDLIRGSDLKLNLLRLKLFKKKTNPGLDAHIRRDDQKNTQKDERSLDVMSNTGIVVIRAPIPGQSFSNEAKSYLSNATCNQLRTDTAENNS